MQQIFLRAIQVELLGLLLFAYLFVTVRPHFVEFYVDLDFFGGW